MSVGDRIAVRPPGRSSIDPVTNITLLAPVRLEEHAGALVTGTLPSDVLPAYLHEATHHWCFFSPVGLALTLLNMRARRRALLLELQGPKELLETRDLDTIDVLDDYLRYDVLTRAQAPLAEGLATFAEFDTLPGDARVATDIMMSVAGHFIRPEEPGDLWEALASALLHERSTYRYASRKTSLLTQAMELDDGGYLAGYLMVKGLWRDAAAINPRLLDRDLFLNLFVTYVYSDFGLVAHLLNPQTSDFGAAPPIVNYFGDRLRLFLDSISDDWLDAIEDTSARGFLDENVEGGLADAFAGMQNLGTDLALWDAGQERLIAMHAELGAEAEDDDGPLGALPRRQLWTLAERQLLVVGRLEVEVDVNERGHVRVWRGDVLMTSGPGVEGARERGRTPGSLEIFINPWRWGRFMAYAVSVDGRPVLTWFSRNLAPVIEEQFLHYQTDTAAASAHDARLADYLEHQLQEDGTAQIVLPAVRKNLSRWARQAYASLALPRLDQAALEAALERMAVDGLLPVLGRLPLVRALAWLSLNWRLHRGDELADAFRDAEVFHGAGDDVRAVVDEIAGLAEAALGEPLVHVHRGQVICTV